MITYKELKKRFWYNRKNGRFLNLRTGANAGTKKGNQQGYIQIKIDGRSYCRHKLTWFYVTGKYPKHRLDHKDLNTSNDRWENLRPANQSQNTFNAKVRKNNKLGLKGVHQVRSRFRVLVGGIHVGYFASAEAAKCAYNERAQVVAGEFFRP